MLNASLLLPEHPRPLRRAEYEKLVALGAFEDERVELIRGVIVHMSPIGPEHANPVDVLTMTLAPALKGRAIVRVQHSMIAEDESMPEPDIAVVPLKSYRTSHPKKTFLIIEVAVSSLKKDRKVKAPLYAESGFPEYWIVNVPKEVVEVYRSPTKKGYRTITVHRRGETIHPEAFPDVAVEVDELFR